MGFELDCKLLKEMLDVLLAVWNADCSVVFTSAQFSLHKYGRAFSAAASSSARSLARSNSYMELTPAFKLTVLLGYRILMTNRMGTRVTRSQIAVRIGLFR